MHLQVLVGTIVGGGTIVTVTNGCEKHSEIIIPQYKHTTKLPVYIKLIIIC